MPDDRTAQEKSEHGRYMANQRWARCENRSEATAAARRNSPSSLTYWERKVDPDQLLLPDERAKRAKNAFDAYFADLRRQKYKKERLKAKARPRKAGGAR